MKLKDYINRSDSEFTKIFTVKVSNILQENGINTIDDLLDAEVTFIKNLPKLGPNSFCQIIDYFRMQQQKEIEKKSKKPENLQNVDWTEGEKK